MSSFFINNELITEDRFDPAKFFEYMDTFDPLTSVFLDEVVKLPQSGLYTVRGEDNRPDLVSYRVYKISSLWWILMAYNRIQDFKSIQTGLQLKYPSLDSIEVLFYSLQSRAQA